MSDCNSLSTSILSCCKHHYHCFLISAYLVVSRDAMTFPNTIPAGNPIWSCHRTKFYTKTLQTTRINHQTSQKEARWSILTTRMHDDRSTGDRDQLDCQVGVHRLVFGHVPGRDPLLLVSVAVKYRKAKATNLLGRRVKTHKLSIGTVF